MGAAALESRKQWKLEDLDAPQLAEARHEIWEGELFAMTRPTNRHNNIAVRVLLQFVAHCEAGSGVFYCGDNDAFVPARDPDTVLSPDAALFRIRPELGASPHHAYAPELAVEVISPSNTRQERMAKRLLYFKHGTEQVWEIDPDARTLEIYFRDGRSLVAQGGIVHGEGIAAGLAFDLSKVFAGPFA